MYRLANRLSIHEARRNSSADHDSSLPDLAETIFGQVPEGRKEGEALRGRVQFEPLVAQGEPVELEQRQFVLNSPKPTYYPNYVTQGNAGREGRISGEYKTLMDEDATLRGWKRYPVRGMKEPPQSQTPNEDNRKLLCKPFRALDAGSRFRGRVHVHNLRTVELGALLWCLTWGQSPKLWHSLGMAKPLGFGGVTVLLDEKSWGGLRPAKEGEPLKEAKDFIKAFADHMQHKVPGWQNSPQLGELKAMADPSCAPVPGLLRYPVLNPDPDSAKRRNEFSDYKQEKASLLPYSQLPRSAAPAARPIAPSPKR
jgi:CRISPR-associated protein (TIGR03986 family)